MSQLLGEDLANTLLGACDLAKRYATENWASVLFALDTAFEAASRMVLLPGAAGCEARHAAIVLTLNIRAARLLHVAADQGAMLDVITRLTTAAITVADVWRSAAAELEEADLQQIRRTIH